MTQAIPILMVSSDSSPDSDERERAIEAGCHEYIPKPLDIKHVISLIERYIHDIKLIDTSNHEIAGR